MQKNNRVEWSTFCIILFCTIDSAYAQNNGVPGLPAPPGSVQCGQGMRYDEKERMCVPCAINKFLYGGQDGACRDCPEGTMSFANSWTVSNCRCKNGHGRTASLQECSMCQLGKYADFPSEQCVLCPVGRYSSSLGMFFCDFCEAGTFIASTGSAGPCQNCQAGKYSAGTGASTCQSCLPGKFSSEFASGQECQNCVRGKYSETHAASSCLDCPVGKSSEHVGATSSLNCQVSTTPPLTTSKVNIESCACCW